MPNSQEPRDGDGLPASAQDRPTQTRIDPTVPSRARIYDYLLGGKDNYASDRAAATSMLRAVPHARAVARANRRFVERAVRHMAEAGVAQFIDLGTGFPARPAVHDIARTLIPDARVLYVDNDPVVTVHNKALLAGGEGVEAINGDIREPYAIFASPELKQLIDLDRPIGLLLAAVLHLIPPEDDPDSNIRTFIKYLMPGSYLAVSHLCRDGTDPDIIAAIENVGKKATAPAVFRTTGQIQAFLDGLDLIPPGLADITAWPGRQPAPAQRPALRVLAGVARMSEPTAARDLACDPGPMPAARENARARAAPRQAELPGLPGSAPDHPCRSTPIWMIT
jgi:hypothetical protein